MAQAADGLAGSVLAGIGLVQQKGGLGKVGNNGARAGAQAAHLPGNAVVHQGIHAAVIGKSGIYKNVRALVAQKAGHFKHLVHLRAGGQIAGIERVKMQPKRGKMPGDWH